MSRARGPHPHRPASALGGGILAALVLFVSWPAGAQEDPIGGPGPFTPGQLPGQVPVGDNTEPPVQSALPPQAVAPHRWEFALEAHEGWDDHPTFVESPDAVSSFSTGASGSLSFKQPTRRGTVSLFGAGSFLRYDSLVGHDGFMWAAGGSGSRRLSTSTDLAGQVSYRSTYTQEVESLIRAGLLLPLTVAKTISSNATLSHRFSKVTTLTTYAHYERYNFDSPEFVDGDSLNAGAILNRALAGEASLGVSYDWFRSDPDGGPLLDFHSVYVNASRRFGRRVSAYGALGGSYYKQPGGGEGFPIVGNARLMARWTQTGFSLLYDHSTSQAYGLGVQRIADTASVDAERRFGRRVSFTASYAYGDSRDILQESTHYRTHAVRGNLSWNLSGGFILEGRGTYWLTTYSLTTGPVRTTNVGCALALSYTGRWR